MPLSPAPESSSTPRRKTARMSTGGRPPRKPSLSAFLDLEAEESDDAGAGEVRSQYGGSFICDDEEEEDEQEEEESGDYIPWEPSPPPAPKSLRPASTVISPTQVSDVVESPSASGMTTRAKAKKIGGASSASTSTASGSSVQPPQVFNPLAHDRTHSNSMKGIPSGSVVLGDVPVDTQRQLVYANTKPVERHRLEELVQLEIPMAEYTQFREFMDKLKTPEKPKVSGGVPFPTSNDSSGPGSTANLDKGKAPIRGGRVQTLAPPAEISEPPGAAPNASSSGAPKTKSRTIPQKRRRVDSLDEPAPEQESIAVPEASMAAFNSVKAQSTPTKPPAKKAKKSAPEQTVFLEEDRFRRVKDLPAKCEVMNVALQDEMLVHAYEKLHLPNLRAFQFHIWSSSRGPGNQRLSLYANHTGLVISVLWGFANFVRKGVIVNLSRVDPRMLEAINRMAEKDRTKWTLCIEGSTAVCVSVGTVVQSSLQVFAPVNAPSRANASTVPLLKFITVVPLCQEFERLSGVCGMVFQDGKLYAQINADAITIGTRSTTHERLNKQQAKSTGMKGIPSASTSYSTQSYSFDKAIPYDAEVPVYDGRNRKFDVNKDIDNIAAILPKYVSDDGEIPNGACVAAAYTVSTYRSGKNQTQNITFNVQWIVVLGEKSDEPIVEADDDAGEDVGDD